MVLGILLILGGAQAVFAQSAEFPEPVFVEAEAESSVPGFWFPAVHDTVYLWALNPGDVSEFIDFIPLATLAAAADSDAPVVPSSVRNNRYYQESVRLTQLAQQTYDGGDYDASTDYAAEALRYAQLSDEFVARQLKIRETNDAIAAARKRLDWAASVNAASRYPAEYGQAQSFYNEAVNYRAAESWDPAIAAARRVINALANVAEAGAVAVTPPPSVNNDGKYPLPAQYTVRPWASSKDCLWNIAGRPWAYGDPTKWRILYEANRSRMPDPGNPDLIHPGMVLDIPSIRGEVRQGMWDAGRTYDPLR
jgi:nucleoid-associated protein YgaU